MHDHPLSSPTLFQLLARLRSHIQPRRQKQFVMLAVLMVLASFAEVVSIGAVLPFLGVLTAPSKIFENPAIQPLIKTLGIASAEQLLLPLTIAFGSAALIAGALRLLLLWASSRLSYASGADLSIAIYRRTLYQSYAIHIGRNSSEIINGISNKAGGVTSTILSLFNLIGSAIMLISILAVLLAVDPLIALTAFGGFSAIYIVIIQLSRERLQKNSQRIAFESTQVIKSLQEGLGGIRDVLIDGSQDIYCEIYRNADQPLRRAHGSIVFLSSSPRFGMEALGMLLISMLAYSLAQRPDGIANAIPVLGALALGAQRLLPALQQAYAAWTSIQGGRASLLDTLELLDQPMPTNAENIVVAPIDFKKCIELIDVTFQYSQKMPYVLKNLNLKIARGSRVGFIGATGSGKSTMLDIVMGLLQPTMGQFKVDNQPISTENQRGWQKHIAHVPQAIFLADSSIDENIAFGVPKNLIDHDRVRKVARQAQVADIIESWPQQYQTMVGERGIRLSGGQRQRIGIARALYKNADLIVFDEATSSLDTETEQSVMQAIEGLSNDLTILIIAHRISTLANCGQIVEIGDGTVKRIGSYDEIANKFDFLKNNFAHSNM